MYPLKSFHGVNSGTVIYMGLCISGPSAFLLVNVNVNVDL